MKNCIILTLALTWSLLGFAYINLGEKSLYVHADRLESVGLWDLVEVACTCSHLLYYPSDKIPDNKKLVVGIRNNPTNAPELLHVIESTQDIEDLIQCGRDYVKYYFIPKGLL